MNVLASSWSRLRTSALLGGALGYLLSNVLNALVPFLLLPVLTRYLSPTQYGVVAIFQALVVGLGAFVGLSAAAAAGRKYFDLPGRDDELAHFIGACLHILLGSALVVALMAWVLESKLFEWTGLEGTWVACAVLMAAFNCLLQLRLGQWQVRGQVLRYGCLQVALALVNAGLSLLFVAVFTMGEDGRILAQLASTGLFAVLAVAFLQRDGLLRLRSWRPEYVREALRYGAPLIPHIGGAIVLTTIDRFFLQAKLGLTEVGIYMVAVQLASAFGLLFDAVNNAYVPWLFERLRRDRAEDRVQIVKYTYFWFAAILSLAAVSFSVGPWVVALVVGPEFERAGALLGWLVLGQVFGGMYLMVANYIFYAKATWLLSLATVSSGVLNVVLLLYLVDLLGLLGAAVSFSAAMAARFLLTWWVAQQRHAMPWFNYKGLVSNESR